MSIDGIITLLKKKGFRDTFKILNAFKDHKCDKHSFYNELNKFSYYNSFFRVKDELINRGLIEIEQSNNTKIVSLTKKGIDVYNKLIEIDELIHGK
ncbi:MAG: hypothetical protein ACFFAN_07580 [Promethearchaeota archaeon]